MGPGHSPELASCQPWARPWASRSSFLGLCLPGEQAVEGWGPVRNKGDVTCQAPVSEQEAFLGQMGPEGGQPWKAMLGLGLTEDHRARLRPPSRVESRVQPMVMGLSPHFLLKTSLNSRPLIPHPKKASLWETGFVTHISLLGNRCPWLDSLCLEWQIGSSIHSQCSVTCCFSPVGDRNTSSASGLLAVVSEALW